MSSSSSRKHLVGVKVLQLSRPVLSRAEILKETPSTLVELPSSFNVYVGEKFSCLVSVYSESTQPVHVNLSVFVVTPSHKETVLVHSDQPEVSEFTLEPGKSTQLTVHYEPKSSGSHSLTTAISYRPKVYESAEDLSDEGSGSPSTQQTPGKTNSSTPTGTSGTQADQNPITNPIVKFHKRNEFLATQALEVRGKVTFIDGNQSAYTFEAEIENVSHNTMILETVDLLPGTGWLATASPNTPDTPLHPKDVWQMAYIVTTDPDATTVTSARPDKFMLGWRREPLGERGWLAL
ncbi:hypothetical protein AWJ20_4775 [Sugiyamaella lignohabitans]|uniref:Trafficking protein particle complex subunit 13 N-terminal domain-containing protein n=1 Tax=Sugiyamaella lignohabitans TaxID=796027 RepID=A0A167EA60_9ASCO|nr:uncharacterized protein AWJ20_4775 [Sugiyamaella lignohabitans]ANB13828.1 hypothetical protein AWJ20_4775 [Sugiyamaella lignohabitans]